MAGAELKSCRSIRRTRRAQQAIGQDSFQDSAGFLAVRFSPLAAAGLHGSVIETVTAS